MLDSTDAADITDTPINVAVIDDNRADSRFLERLLTGLSGWKIDASVYDSPDNALPHLKESPPDVLFVDYLLGHEMTGIDVMERFQAEGINSAFILMTGHGSEKVAADALRTGAKDYLIKDTLTAENLDRSLRYVCERKKSDETIQGLALSDALTGLANRNAFNRRMDDALIFVDIGEVGFFRFGDFYSLRLVHIDPGLSVCPHEGLGHVSPEPFRRCAEA